MSKKANTLSNTAHDLIVQAKAAANLSQNAVTDFENIIISAKSAGANYRDNLQKALVEAYAAFHFYCTHENDQAAMRQAAEKECVGKYTITTGKTKIDHIILMLTFGEQSTASKSQRARVMRKAADAEIQPENFAQWIKDQGGIVAALESDEVKAKRKGKDSRKEFQKNVDDGLKKLRKSKNTLFVDQVLVPEADRPQEGSRAFVAILDVNPAGDFYVRAFVKDEDALNAAYAAYGKSGK